VKPAQPEDREVFLDGREHQLLPASVHDSERIRLAAEPLAATLEKCVDPPIDPADVDAIKLVESALDHLDPLASIVFTVSCASCSVPIQITLDVPGLVRDLWRSDDLHRDNDHHLLALAYGWKPDDMLPLRPVERRRFAMTLVDRWET
jgi:hypothetical protein